MHEPVSRMTLEEIDAEVDAILRRHGSRPYHLMPPLVRARFDALCERQEALVMALPD